MDKGISHVLSMSILLYGLRRPIFNSQDKEPYSFVGLKAQEKTGLLLMPTAKVTKNVSAAEGGGNVLCSILISIKTKAWLYFYGTHALPISICIPVIRSNSRLYLAIRFSSNTFSSIPTFPDYKLSGLQPWQRISQRPCGRWQ